MATMTAKFKGVDELSDVLGRMANLGEEFIDQWEKAGT